MTPFSGTMTPIKIHLFFCNNDLLAASSKVKSFKTSNWIGTLAALKTSKTEPEFKLIFTGDFRTNTNTWDQSNVLNFSIEWFVNFSVSPAGFKTEFEGRKNVSESQHFS